MERENPRSPRYDCSHHLGPSRLVIVSVGLVFTINRNYFNLGLFETKIFPESLFVPTELGPERLGFLIEIQSVTKDLISSAEVIDTYLFASQKNLLTRG